MCATQTPSSSAWPRWPGAGAADHDHLPGASRHTVVLSERGAGTGYDAGMTDLPGDHEPTSPSSPPRVLIIDIDGVGSAYPEDRGTLLERRANLDPLNNPTVGAITKTTTTTHLPSLSY